MGFAAKLSRGHGKVISRSQQGQISSKWLKVEYQHFKTNGGNPPQVHMVTSVGVWFHRGVIKAIQCNAMQVNARQCNEKSSAMQRITVQ